MWGHSTARAWAGLCSLGTEAAETPKPLRIDLRAWQLLKPAASRDIPLAPNNNGGME